MFLTGARIRLTSASAACSAAAFAMLPGSTPSACSTADTLDCTTALLAIPTNVVDMLGFLHNTFFTQWGGGQGGNEGLHASC